METASLQAQAQTLVRAITAGKSWAVFGIVLILRVDGNACYLSRTVANPVTDNYGDAFFQRFFERLPHEGRVSRGLRGIFFYHKRLPSRTRKSPHVRSETL